MGCVLLGKMDRFRKVIVFWGLLLALALVLSADEKFPEDIRLERVSYSKVTISWLPPDVTTKISYYVIIRNGEEVDSTTALYYTDESVHPGEKYIYRVMAVLVDGRESGLSNELSVQTLTPSDIESSELVEEIVDGFHDESPSNLNAVSLLSAVKAGAEALFGSNLLFSVVDEDIVTAAITDELDWINKAATEPTEAERLDAQAEIEELMESSFAGNPFDHLYINQQLAQLGDRHWKAGNKIAAELFYEISLNYLGNHESTVFQSLSRLAYFSREHLTQDSSCSEISDGLSTARSHLHRYFDFFPESEASSTLARMALAQPIGWFFSYFPRMLEYSNYDTLFFATALEDAEQLVSFVPDDINAERTLDKIGAWELAILQLRLVDERGSPRNGSVRISNVSAENGRDYLFPEGTCVDERDIILSNGETAIPVYAGHDYSISLNVDIPDGKDLRMELPSFRYGRNKRSSLDYLTGSFKEAFSPQTTVEFIVSSEAFPYNLRVDSGIDVFDLSWDWVAPMGFETAGFKVYCGDAEVASVTGQTVRLPMIAPEDENSYRVVAFDINGNSSIASPILFVYPRDTKLYGDFLEWMECYFGDSLLYASDDPDGDGVDNYHEFLNGTDPTKIPGPTPYAGPIGFNELTLEWEAVSDDSGGATYQISRNGNIVGLSPTGKFVDSNLVPGVTYSYRVRQIAPPALETDWGRPNTFATQRSHCYENADKVQHVVDAFLRLNIFEQTSSSLFSAVRSAMEALTCSTIPFTVIKQDLVEEMVEQELALLRDVSPPMTTAERIAAKGELDRLMAEWWEGNSFEEMYINAKLTELAENHWKEFMADRTRTSSKTAATELLEASLFFLKSHEPTVGITLARLARMELLSLDAGSTDDQVKEALDASRDILLRVYDYFPAREGVDWTPYNVIIRNYQKFFPRLLAYDKYDKELFGDISQMAAAYRDGNILDERRRCLYEEVVSWRIDQLTVESGVRNGTITFENTTPFYPAMPWVLDEECHKDIRTFQLDGSALMVPIYAGHIYDITVRIPVEGGEDWIHTTRGLRFNTGRIVIDNPFSGITFEDQPAGDATPVYAFPVNNVNYPYNLTYVLLPDSFILSWQYVPGNDSAVNHFNIYRGNTLVTACTGMTSLVVPRLVHDDGIYAYSVAAVDIDGLESPRSPIVEVLPDFTDEEQRYFEWKHYYFGNEAVLATDDNDQDGLTNYQEFLLGSNPTFSALSIDLSDVTERLPGAIISYYSAFSEKMPDFAGLKPYMTEIRSDFCFKSMSGDILGAGKSEQVAFVADGFFDIKDDGYYSFVVKSDDGVEFLLNGVEVINHSLVDAPREKTATLFLRSGINSFQVRYFNYLNDAELQIKWGVKGGAMVDFASEYIWHLGDVPEKLREYIATRKDSDGDMLSDMDEMLYGTSFFNPDTDGDGLSDYAELKLYFTNPNSTDTNGNGLSDAEEIRLNGGVVDLNNVFFSFIREIKGAAFVDSVGRWECVNDMAHALERRGFLTYDIQIDNAGIHKLEFMLMSVYSSCADTPFDIFIDDMCIASSFVQLSTEPKCLAVTTPYLQRGHHTVTIHWDNHRPTEDLLVDKLMLYCIGIPLNESFNDELPLMLVSERIVDERNKVASQISSRVSPFCLTGSSEYPMLTRVNGESSTVIGERKWMYDVSPSDSAVVDTRVTFENDAVEKISSIAWHPTDIVKESGLSLKIRRGDALLLTASCDASSSWTATGRKIDLSGEEGQNKVYKFDVCGKYIITGSCFNSSDERIITGSIFVDVIDYDFSRDDVVCIVNYGREWSVDPIPDSVKIVLDSRYKAALIDTNNGSIPYLKIFVDDNKERYNYASIDTDGNESILSVQKIQGMEVFSSNYTGIRQVISTDDMLIGDDMKVYSMQIIASPVHPEVEFRLNIFVAGVTFDDGTVSKSIFSTDFSPNGVCSVDFVRPNEVFTSICHTLKAYHHNEYIGVRQK